MTEPIQKLNLGDGPAAQPGPPRRRGMRRWVVAGLALAALFAGVVLAMLLALPRPHTSGDYMIAGGVATMVVMLAGFGLLISTESRPSDSFFKKRPK